MTLHLDTLLRTATPQEAVLSKWDASPRRALILSAALGSAQSPLLDQLPYPRDATGRLQADACGEVSAADGVWAGGDCAAIPMREGVMTPPLALYAMHSGAT